MSKASNIYKMKRSKNIRPFTIVDNEFIYKAELSPLAKFLIIYLLGLPEDWVMCTKHIRNEFQIGKDKIGMIIAELTEAGYMERYQTRTKGKMSEYVTRYSYFPEYKKDNNNNYIHKEFQNHGAESGRGNSQQKPRPDIPGSQKSVPETPEPMIRPLQIKYINNKKNNNLILNNNHSIVEFDKIDLELSELEREFRVEESELEAERVSCLVRDIPNTPSNPLTEARDCAIGSQPIQGQRVEEKSLVEEIFDDWKLKLKHPRAKLDIKRKKLIENALRDYSPDDIMQAFDGCSKTPHNMGENDRGEVYDGLHIILRDAEQIERFMRNSINPPKVKDGQTKTRAQKVREYQDKLAKHQERLLEEMRQAELAEMRDDNSVYGQICGQNSGGTSLPT